MRAGGWLCGLLLIGAATPGGDRLAVYSRGEWRTWWLADAARTHWDAPDTTFTNAVSWQSVQPGLERADVRIAARAPALRIRLVLLRIDPAAFDWRLVEKRNERGDPAWEAEAAASDAAFALNAGQFARGRAWGWLVRAGQEMQPPGRGPLSMAFVIDRDGRADLVPAARIAQARAGNAATIAFQSYPTLLEDDGAVPAALRSDDGAVDLKHRDSRLAIGRLRDGRLIVALTRFDIGGGVLRPVPIGPNTPEMAAIMGALGCASAVMLDGGISSQLLVRDARGSAQTWGAYRWVPLGLEATPRVRRP